MLRKIAVIFLVAVYMLSNIGVFAEIHLCGGSVTNVNVLQADNEYKCACKAMTDNNCCHDIQVKSSVETEGLSVLPYVLKSYSFQYTDLFTTGSEIHASHTLVNKNTYRFQTNWRDWQLLQSLTIATTVLRS